MQDMLFADEDDDVVLPDAAEKFDELLTRWLHVHVSSSTIIISNHTYFQSIFYRYFHPIVYVFG